MPLFYVNDNLANPDGNEKLPIFHRNLKCTAGIGIAKMPKPFVPKIY